MKQVYLVHGWDGNPNNAWFPWLIKQLQENGFEAQALVMPTPEHPDPQTWPAQLVKDIPNPDQNTILVGHSIGCQTIMRYLANLPDNTKVGGVVFVAPFFQISHIESREKDELEIWNPWQNNPVDRKKFSKNANQLVCIFSDDDPDVDYESNARDFKELGAKIILEHNKDHFSDDAGVMELPSALEAIKNF